MEEYAVGEGFLHIRLVHVEDFLREAIDPTFDLIVAGLRSVFEIEHNSIKALPETADVIEQFYIAAFPFSQRFEDGNGLLVKG